MIKKHLYISLSLVFFFAIGCTNSPKKEVSIFQKIKQKKVLRVALLNNSIDYFLYRGTPMGFHYELAKAYAKHLDVELDLTVADSYPQALNLIETGECDILASNVNITGSRKRKMLFSTPLLRSNAVLVQNKNSKQQYVKNWLDSDILQVTISGEATSKRIVENIQEDLGIYIDISYDEGIVQEELIDKVADGTILATFSDKMTAKVAKTYHRNLDISIDASLPHNMSWALPLKATELQQDLNKWMKSYKQTRNYRHLYTKYFLNTKSILRNKGGNIASGKRLSPYDRYIKKEARKLGWDWRLLAALIYTESRFDPSQVSWAGAFGIMQLMPLTANNFGASRDSPVGKQIEAGRKYIQYLEEEFSQSMTDKTDIKRFILGAYNSGSGHIIDAQNLAEKHGKDRDKWNEVAPYILLLNNPKYYTDETVKYGYFRGKETVNHVNRITDLYENYKELVRD